jgi:hypothetical protein
MIFRHIGAYKQIRLYIFLVLFLVIFTVSANAYISPLRLLFERDEFALL